MVLRLTIREKMEQWETEFLSPYASLSRNSKGRDREEPPCDIRPVYQRDRDRDVYKRQAIDTGKVFPLQRGVDIGGEIQFIPCFSVFVYFFHNIIIKALSQLRNENIAEPSYKYSGTVREFIGRCMYGMIK